MTRRHYIAFAAIIAGEVACLAPHERERRETLRRVMLSTADMFARDNGRFDRDRFYAACGLDRYAEAA